MDEANKQVEITAALTLNVDSTIATLVFVSDYPMSNDGFIGAAEEFIKRLRKSGEEIKELTELKNQAEAEKPDAPNNECGAV